MYLLCNYFLWVLFEDILSVDRKPAGQFVDRISHDLGLQSFGRPIAQKMAMITSSSNSVAFNAVTQEKKSLKSKS